MPSAVLAQHAVAIANCLDDEDSQVRGAAVRAMGNLELTVLSSYINRIIQLLSDKASNSRHLVLHVLCRIVKSDSPALQQAAIEVLQSVGPRALAEALADLPNNTSIDVHLFIALAEMMGKDTLLHHAARFGCQKLVHVLIKDCDSTILHARDAFGNTALHAAAIEGHLDICRSLVRAGACTNGKNQHLQTPADLALTRTHTSAELSMAIHDLLTTGENSRCHTECGFRGRGRGPYRERVYYKGESVLLGHEVRQGRVSIRFQRSRNSCPPQRARSSLHGGKCCSRSSSRPNLAARA